MARLRPPRGRGRLLDLLDFRVVLDELGLVGPALPVVLDVEVDVELGIVHLVQVVVIPGDSHLVRFAEGQVECGALEHDQYDRVEIGELGQIHEQSRHVLVFLSRLVEDAEV